MNVKVTKGKHPGTASIWEVDENGETINDYPLISFGKKKFEAIMKSITELKKIFGECDEN